MKEFFGFGGYTRPAEGFFSWQHLVFVTSLMVAMVLLALLFGRQNRNGTLQQKNKVLIWTAFLIDGFELLKIVILCCRSESLQPILHNLPLFLCSIQLIAIPMAAFCKGRVKEAALDFVCIFGILGAVAGTYGAGQNYNAYPVLSFDNVVSGITHSLSGFASLYIMFTRMAGMKRSNIVITYTILLGFCVAAYIADITIPYNYMFLISGDGTPYDILYNLVGGSPVLYPIGVVALFLVYISAFYFVVSRIRRKAKSEQTV